MSIGIGCAVSCNSHNTRPDLFSLEIDDQIKPREILIVLVGESVFFSDKENVAMRYKATAHQCFNGDPAIHYDTFDEFPAHPPEDEFLLLLKGGLSFTSVLHVIESRWVATCKRRLAGEDVTFQSVMRSQLVSLCKEIEKKQKN